jgi:hypothetical protein
MAGDAARRDAGAPLCESCRLLVLQHTPVTKDHVAPPRGITKTIPVPKNRADPFYVKLLSAVSHVDLFVYTIRSSIYMYISC